jgi:hypothetical protein
MSKTKETLDKAYGNVPKELPGNVVWDDLFPIRGIKYYCIVLWRKFAR